MSYGYAEADRRKAFTMLWQYAPLPGTLDILPSYAGDDFDPSVDYFLPSTPIQQAVTPTQRQRGQVNGAAIGGAASDVYNIWQRLKGQMGTEPVDTFAASNVSDEQSGIPTWAKIAGGVAALGVVGFVIYKVTR